MKMGDEHFSLQGGDVLLLIFWSKVISIFLHVEAWFGKISIEAEMKFLAQ